MAAIAMIPTLDTQSILSDPRDILGYQLAFYTRTPKSVSDTTPWAIVSMADAISRYQYNQSALVAAVTQDLKSVYARFFTPPAGSVSVDVSTSDNADGTYDVTINLSAVSNGVPYTLGADVTVNAAGSLHLKYHPALPSPV
jgi:hypothetical protein